MKDLNNILNNYENDIKYWSDDFGEGHLFLGNREALVKYEGDERVHQLDILALETIKKDKSKGSDKLFLQEIKKIILASSYYQEVA